MASHDDDLAGWADDPLVRALTAPGTPEELAGADAALAAFRAATPGRSRRRLAGRFGAGATTVVIAIGLSGGVAAAYTNSLPSPIQRVAHGLLGDVGVPAVTAARGGGHNRHGHGARTAAATLGQPNPQVSGGGGGSAGTASPSPAPSPAAGGPTPSPTPGSTGHAAPGKVRTSPSSGSSAHPSGTPTPTPSPTSTAGSRPVPAALSISPSSRRVPVGSDVTLTGVLTTSSGTPVGGRRVWVVERSAGEKAGRRVAVARTASDGTVAETVTSLSQDVRLKLVAIHGVHSSPVTVVVVPTVSVSGVRNGKQDDVTITTVGGRPGDEVVLQRRQQGSWVQIASLELDASGTTSSSLPIPARVRRFYRVILVRTSAHARATARFVVAAA
jgi:hypothetical protein